MTWTQFGVGAYRAGDGHLLHRSRTSRDATDKLIVVCHGRAPGATYGCLQWAQNTGGGPPHLMALVDHGYAAMPIDAAGDLAWANQASEDAVGQAISWARAQGACHPTAKVLLFGYSMGGAVVLNYAHNHAADVAGLLLEAPGVDIESFYADPTYGPEIDSAYASSGGWPVNVGRSPQRFAAQIAMPTRIYTALDDATVPNSMVHTFYDALPAGAKIIKDLPNGGHAGFWGNIDALEQAALNAWADGLPW